MIESSIAGTRRIVFLVFVFKHTVTSTLDSADKGAVLKFGTIF